MENRGFEASTRSEVGLASQSFSIGNFSFFKKEKQTDLTECSISLLLQRSSFIDLLSVEDQLLQIFYEQVRFLGQSAYTGFELTIQKSTRLS